MSAQPRTIKTAWHCRTCKQPLYYTRLGNLWCTKCNATRNYKYTNTMLLKIFVGKGRTTVGRKPILTTKRGRRKT